MSIVKNFIINRFATSHQESDAVFQHPPGSPLKKFTKEQYSLVIGNGLRGKLGVGYTRHLTSLTKHEELPEGIIHLQCGDLHAVSLTDFAQISTWGSNEFGQLGYDTSGVNDNVSFFDIMGGDARPAKTKKPREDPKLCELSAVLPTLITQKITRVVAGKDFTFAITEKGTAYSFGKNNYGQLALGSHEDCNEPMLIHFFEGNRVNDIVAGGAHAHAVLLDNEVYSWGSNERGQLGLSSLFEEVCDFAVPQQINAIIEMRIKKITTGFNHSMVLTQNHRVISWGSNEFGQLGVGDQDDRHDVTLVYALRSLTILDVWCSHSSSYALASDWSLFVWGRNDRSQLGLGETTTKFVSTPIRLQTEPISRFFTGPMSHHAFYETKTKKIFGFGSNEYRETCGAKADAIWEPEDVTAKLQKDDYVLDTIVTGLECTFFLYK